MSREHRACRTECAETFPRGAALGLALFVALGLAAPRAEAASAAGAQRMARKACLEGDLAKGVSILADLYIETKNPVYIFNQARCYEQSGKYEEAIIRFREYQVKQQDAGRPLDPDAERRIATCQALLDAQKEKDKASMAPPAPPVTAPPSVAAPVVPAPAAVPTVSEPDVSTSPPPLQVAEVPVATNTGLRAAGISALILGGAGIAAGVILNLKANSLASEIENKTEYPDLGGRKNTRSSYETWGWISYSVGGACLAGGAVLTWLGYRQGGNNQLALSPSVGSGIVGAAVQGAF